MTKKIILIISLGIITILLTGCIKRDTYEDVTIYTTVYPIEYITKQLYGEHSQVQSIYPDGVHIENYTLTEKQIKDYSKASIFVFNGLSNEKDYVVPMFNQNKNLKIIDTSLSMEYTYDIHELWLDPSNFLKMAQNIKSGFHEIINNHYLKNNISEKYEKLKIEVSNLDAKLSVLSSSSNNKTIVTTSNLFKFLEKYNFTVISLDEKSTVSEKTIQDVKNLIQDGKISYIFTKQNEDIGGIANRIKEETGVEFVTLHTISNITDKEKSANKDYISLMNENIELLKQELYD